MKKYIFCAILLAILSSCSKEDPISQNPFVGKWQCYENKEPNGIFNKDYIYFFDASGVFYNIYDGEEHERGVYHGNDRDLYINIGSSLIHWDVVSISTSEMELYSTRSGYSPGSAKLKRIN